MTEPWTVDRIVRWMATDFAGRGISSPRLDAELLTAHALGVDRVGLYLDLKRALAEEERSTIRALVERRRRFEPVAYILGKREFYGLEFEVSPAVLIPRPDTEPLVERALESSAGKRVLDIGTGSGAIAITIAKREPSATVHATDISTEALTLARRNAERLGVEVVFEEADLFPSASKPFDIIVTNPPYIAESEMPGLMPDVRDHEPSLALVGGQNGYEIIERILAEAPHHLTADGLLLMEVGETQAAEVSRRAEKHGFTSTFTVMDLSGIERVVGAHLGQTARAEAIESRVELSEAPLAAIEGESYVEPYEDPVPPVDDAEEDELPEDSDEGSES